MGFEYFYGFVGKINKLTFNLEAAPKPAVEARAELGPIVKVSEPDPIDTSER